MAGASDRDPPALLAASLAALAASCLLGEGLAAGSGEDIAIAGWSYLFAEAMLGLSLGLIAAPGRHVGLGLSMVAVSAVSLIDGGGFVAGAVLGFVVGFAAVVFEPEEEAQPLPPSIESEEAPVVPRPAVRPPPLPVIGTFRPCPECGEAVAWSDRNCKHCAAALDPHPGAARVIR